VIERAGETPAHGPHRETVGDARGENRARVTSARCDRDQGQHIQTGYSAVAVVLSFWTLTISIFFMAMIPE